MNRKELIENLNTGDYGDRFTDYSEGYICDVIGYIADSSVDIYYNDLFEWLKGNWSYCDEAVEEGLYSTDSKNFSITQLIQVGQYKQIQDDLYENLDESIQCFIYYNLELEEINEDLQEFIENLCDDIDNNKQLEDVLQEVIDYMKNEVEEQ